ncbi:MAG TPA: flippase activity-associated protein Agl23 [Candidatus Xenobia bacterium]
MSTWWRAAIAILLVGAALRLVGLNRPLFHVDEAVNGWFLDQALKGHDWVYNKDNFNGPTLLYSSLPWVRMVGLSDVSCRLVPVAFSLLTIALILCLHPALGRTAALWAAWWYAISPGAVYFARDYVHESVFVCFTLAAVVPWLHMERLGLWWTVMASFAAAALLFCTQETALYPLLSLLAAEFLSNGERRLTRASPAAVVGAGLAGLLVFLAIWATLYSSFFLHPASLVDALGAQPFWSHGGRADWPEPAWQYLLWLGQNEPLLAVLAVGAIGGLLRYPERRTRFRKLIAWWLLGVLLFYSWPSHKTPWECLDLILPLSLLAGVASEHLQEVMATRHFGWCHLGWSVVMLSQCVWLCFLHADDPAVAYVSEPTAPATRALLAQVQEGVAAAGHGRIACCASMDDYWPLPWYLRDYADARWWATATMAAASNPDVVIFRSDPNPDVDQTPVVETILSDDYEFVGKARIRDGVTLEVWRRRVSPLLR